VVAGVEEVDRDAGAGPTGEVGEHRVGHRRRHAQPVAEGVRRPAQHLERLRALEVARSLLGEPQYKEPIEDGFGAFRGERWQYQIDGRMVTVTIVSGKVGDIQIEQR
jgi:hypothetical protein